MLMLPRTKLVWWRWWLQLPVSDSSGSILCSAAWKFSRIDSALCAELLAICIGDEMALFQDLHGVIIETDSAMSISEISKGQILIVFGGSSF